MAKRITKRPERGRIPEPDQVTARKTGLLELPWSVPETVILVAAVLLLAALAYTIQPILSPFVLVGAVVYLLYPLRENILARRIMWLSILLFMLWFFHSILGLLAPFILAFLVAYLINPAVTVLEQRNFPRWASSLIAVVLLVGVVVAALLFVMPLAIQQFQGILAGVNLIAKDVAELLKSGAIFEVLARYGIPVEKAREVIGEQISPRLEHVLTNLFEAVLGFVTGISTVLMQVINAVIIPFLVFYILKDFPVITHSFVKMVPKHRRNRFVELIGKVDALIGRYIRGAITVAIIQGIISAIGLTLIGVRYALVLGIMTGILNFIPYVGLITSLVVSGIVALFSGDPILAKIAGVVVLYLSQKLFEASVLGPKIIGSQVGLHPVLLILCLLVFGYFLGFIGLLIAVPSTALIIMGVKEWGTSRTKVMVEQATP